MASGRPLLADRDLLFHQNLLHSDLFLWVLLGQSHCFYASVALISLHYTCKWIMPIPSGYLESCQRNQTFGTWMPGPCSAVLYSHGPPVSLHGMTTQPSDPHLPQAPLSTMRDQWIKQKGTIYATRYYLMIKSPEVPIYNSVMISLKTPRQEKEANLKGAHVKGSHSHEIIEEATPQTDRRVQMDR